MENKTQTFKRKEIKYLIDQQTKDNFFKVVASHLAQDSFGKATIRNIYYDSPDNRLIRTSIEKPTYKEKLRVRCYNDINSDSKVYIELKKKYDGIVYKRRLAMKENQIDSFLGRETPAQGQIQKEVSYFLNFYKNLGPAMYLSYIRDAYFCKDNSNLRITFDHDIGYRTEDLDLISKPYGTELLSPNTYVMEIKCSDAMPLWLTSALSKNKIYKESFSKYGKAYLNELKTEKRLIGGQKIA